MELKKYTVTDLAKTVSIIIISEDKMLNGKLFLKNIKLLITKKSENFINDIIIMEHNVINKYPYNFSNIKNEYYVNITRTRSPKD